MIETLIPAAMYAETHFRFGGWTPSALFRREPEIVFDLPRRAKAGADLPVALLINDVHRYPVHPKSITIAISQSRPPGNADRNSRGDGTRVFEFDSKAVEYSRISAPATGQQLAYVFAIPRGELPDGEIFVNALLNYQRVKNGVPRGKIHTALNDNLVTSTKFAYRCTIARRDYPGGELCTYGDVHCHSVFSRSHVEWGPPFEVIDRIASASGLKFAAMTDHSYDLACDPDNYLRQDKNLRQWELYRASIDNYGGTTVLIPGEEVSVLNSRGKVVHLCGLGLKEYIPGSLDGARKNIRGDRQLTIEEAVREIERQGGVSFAAHPGVTAGLFQRAFLRRGTWSDADLSPGLNGIQAVNSDFFNSWIRAKRLWVSMLLKGRRVPILAGSDAHGDFNRYRATGVPFVQIHEGQERYMGSVRTGVYGNHGDANGIVNGIKNAAAFVTNGPFVTICDARRPDISLVGSKTVSVGESTSLRARAVSTEEFGPLEKIKVIVGVVGATEEKTIIDRQLPPDTFDTTVPVPAEELPQNGSCYLRVESRGKTPRGLTTTAASSACFVGE